MEADPALTRSASHSARAVAALRAAHQIHDAAPRILEDPIAERLLDERARRWVREEAGTAATADLVALRSHVVVRSRFAEDRLEEAVARGVGQCVVLGAGYDTFAYRQPPWASGLRLFEVDQPGSQTDKRSRLAAAAIDVPANLTFVPVDFEHEALSSKLEASGFDAAQPAFFSWLGVTTYLEEDANDAVLRFVASLPASSEIVFTFAPIDEAGATASRSRFAALAAAGGEPWLTFYAPAALAQKLRALGFSPVWLPAPAEIAARYFAGRTDGLPAPRRRSLVSAVVPAVPVIP